MKVIIETSYLSNPETELACRICADAGADFVKTSTGFASSEAALEHIALMKKPLPAHVDIRGIKTLERTEALIRGGARRIGTSSGTRIITTKR